jgi:hypothetical protein
MGLFEGINDPDEMLRLAAKKKQELDAKAEVPQLGSTRSTHEDALIKHRIRRRWLATMHLLGASFGQLAKSLGIQSTTVMRSVDKELPVATRAAQRLSTSMSYEQLSWYTARYRDEIPNGIADRQPIQVAQWLLQFHPYQQGE